MEEIIKITKIGLTPIDKLCDESRRWNPITYELLGEWEDGVYVFDDLFDLTETKISHILIVNNNKVMKVYKNLKENSI